MSRADWRAWPALEGLGRARRWRLPGSHAVWAQPGGAGADVARLAADLPCGYWSASDGHRAGWIIADALGGPLHQQLAWSNPAGLPAALGALVLLGRVAGLADEHAGVTAGAQPLPTVDTHIDETALAGLIDEGCAGLGGQVDPAALGAAYAGLLAGHREVPLLTSGQPGPAALAVLLLPLPRALADDLSLVLGAPGCRAFTALPTDGDAAARRWLWLGPSASGPAQLAPTAEQQHAGAAMAAALLGAFAGPPSRVAPPPPPFEPLSEPDRCEFRGASFEEECRNPQAPRARHQKLTCDGDNEPLPPLGLLAGLEELPPPLEWPARTEQPLSPLGLPALSDEVPLTRTEQPLPPVRWSPLSDEPLPPVAPPVMSMQPDAAAVVRERPVGVAYPAEAPAPASAAPAGLRTLRLWGAASSGKTAYLAQLFTRYHHGGDPAWSVRLPPGVNQAWFEARLAGFEERNRFPEPTPAGASDQVNYWLVNEAAGRRALIAVEDRPGRDYETFDAETARRLAAADGLLLLLDPLRDPATQNEEVARGLLAIQQARASAEPDPRPLALCVSKCDALIRNVADLRRAREDPAGFLERHIGQTIREAVGHYFRRHRVFAVSAAGLRVSFGAVLPAVFYDEHLELRISRAGVPLNLLAPLLWLLNEIEP